jgi:hypothetical protein
MLCDSIGMDMNLFEQFELLDGQNSICVILASKYFAFKVNQNRDNEIGTRNKNG